jgi:hypothetical protein
VLFDGDFCLNREKAKGKKRKKTIIAEGGRDAEDAESRKRKVKRHKDLRSCGRREDIGVS